MQVKRKVLYGCTLLASPKQNSKAWLSSRAGRVKVTESGAALSSALTMLPLARAPSADGSAEFPSPSRTVERRLLILPGDKILALR